MNKRIFSLACLVALAPVCVKASSGLTPEQIEERLQIVQQRRAEVHATLLAKKAALAAQQQALLAQKAAEESAAVVDSSVVPTSSEAPAQESTQQAVQEQPVFTATTLSPQEMADAISKATAQPDEERPVTEQQPEQKVEEVVTEQTRQLPTDLLSGFFPVSADNAGTAGYADDGVSYFGSDAAAPAVTAEQSNPAEDSSISGSDAVLAPEENAVPVLPSETQTENAPLKNSDTSVQPVAHQESSTNITETSASDDQSTEQETNVAGALATAGAAVLLSPQDTVVGGSGALSTAQRSCVSDHITSIFDRKNLAFQAAATAAATLAGAGLVGIIASKYVDTTTHTGKVKVAGLSAVGGACGFLASCPSGRSLVAQLCTSVTPYLTPYLTGKNVATTAAVAAVGLGCRMLRKGKEHNIMLPVFAAAASGTAMYASYDAVLPLAKTAFTAVCQAFLTRRQG